MLSLQRLMHLFYWSLVFTLVHLLDFLVKARLFLHTIFVDRQKGQRNDDLVSSSNKWLSNLTPPRHIAFHLEDPRYANEEFICSLARHCAAAGIGRLTLSASGTLLTSATTTTTTGAWTNAKNGGGGDTEKPIVVVADDGGGAGGGTKCANANGGNAFRLASLTKRMSGAQRQNGDVSTAVVLRRLANDAGRTAVVRACKKFSMSQSPITPEQLNAVLTDYDEQQPDFFVRVGGPVFWQSAVLTAHTPLAIRTTEFYCVDGFLNDRMLSDREFHTLLQEFAARSRRFGR